ncbi:MAG TPA: dihydroorotase [Ignavibacteriaceae bacterium]|jgi:dihydroorotase|nr:MAG: Dihydroorotase [Ignavibacteria bacterium ADurb.Bin266]OQY70416.1 MAG: dihydroorotase [Ignavibacteriales bacterium UTCHB2]HQF43342.1 dihydroorotase [Ignavibacteriaceae bacterium]HQI39653.1 dihydroorotase [Ignavibacteriaceae bacterium]
MKLVLKNVNLLNPDQKLNEKDVDVLIEDGKYKKIGKLTEAELKDAKVLELKGKYLVPGLFDMHVHLREPGREDEETVITGCNAAANGGFTGIACMPNTEPAIDSAEVVTLIKKQSAKHLVDVYPIGAATVERKGEILSPMAELKDAGVVGFSDDGVAIKTASILKRALEYARMFDLPIIEHCEDETLAGGAMNESINSTLLGLPPIPAIAEDLIVMRDILMAEYANAKVHISHISSKKSVQMVRDAKKKGIKVTAEVTPHHFTLTDDAVKTYDPNVKMNPPLRTRADVDEILAGLKDGTIDCIASDHAPHSLEEKEMEFEYAPNGIIGLETQVGLAFTELFQKKILNLEQLIEKLSINPRKILNISIPQVKEGEPVNLTILDPDAIWTVDKTKFKSKSVNTPFDKRLLTGKSVGVINKNQMFIDGKFERI